MKKGSILKRKNIEVHIVDVEFDFDGIVIIEFEVFNHRTGTASDLNYSNINHFREKFENYSLFKK